MTPWRTLKVASFKYDPFGRRIKKSSSSGTSVFAYDGDNLVEETNSTGTVVARYEQTQNIDEPLAMLPIHWFTAQYCLKSFRRNIYGSPASVANKGLTVLLSPLDATLIKNQGVGRERLSTEN